MTPQERVVLPAIMFVFSVVLVLIQLLIGARMLGVISALSLSILWLMLLVRAVRETRQARQGGRTLVDNPRLRRIRPWVLAEMVILLLATPLIFIVLHSTFAITTQTAAFIAVVISIGLALSVVFYGWKVSK